MNKILPDSQLKDTPEYCNFRDYVCYKCRCDFLVFMT